MKHAYLVLGPESSGTRLVTGILTEAGCVGSDDHMQPHDTEAPTADRIVWRRSVPHAHQWPPIDAMVSTLRHEGYDVRALVTTRDWYSMVISQVNANHVADRDMATRNLHRAYPHIFTHLNSAAVPFVVVSYEAIVQRPQAMVAQICDWCELATVPEVAVYDGNAKYYEGEDEWHAVA